MFLENFKSNFPSLSPPQRSRTQENSQLSASCDNLKIHEMRQFTEPMDQKTQFWFSLSKYRYCLLDVDWENSIFLNLFSRDDTYLYFWVLAPAEDVYPKSFRLFFQKENSKRVRKEVGNISISCDIVMTDNFSYINFSRL